MTTGKPHPTSPKTISQLAREWDEIAIQRHRQITSGIDVSFKHVLVPMTLELLKGCDTTQILDVGCGTGELTELLAREAQHVVAIDLSSQSIEMARRTIHKSNIELQTGALEELTPKLRNRRFSTAVASMTLMTTPSLQDFAEAIAKILPANTHFIATITHPCFWPRYWNYESAKWFSYAKEIFIEAPFRISTESSDIVTTHIHRPLGSYITIFEKCGFQLVGLREPMPDAAVTGLYPQPWEFPRFLGLKWLK